MTKDEALKIMRKGVALHRKFQARQSVKFLFLNWIPAAIALIVVIILNVMDVDVWRVVFGAAFVGLFIGALLVAFRARDKADRLYSTWRSQYSVSQYRIWLKDKIESSFLALGEHSPGVESRILHVFEVDDQDVSFFSKCQMRTEHEVYLDGNALGEKTFASIMGGQRNINIRVSFVFDGSIDTVADWYRSGDDLTCHPHRRREFEQRIKEVVAAYLDRYQTQIGFEVQDVWANDLSRALTAISEPNGFRVKECSVSVTWKQESEQTVFLPL
ncbi:TPA: hypothetical protein DF272_00405 [Candidatus Falkowbacteria bacterium]|nr:hypothetical protein [Candidatus Falkowbacteria bacterium]